MSRHTHPNRGTRLTQVALWGPGLAVALGAAVATAHGLNDVAVAAGIKSGIAWLYPLITDGLAVVAYAAATQLTGRARGYAWAIVVLAAGMSGVAQAVYLAGGVAHSPTPGQAPVAVPTVLRFGLGAWPAVAAAIVAHLLFMLAAEGRTQRPASPAEPTDGERVAPADRAHVVQPPRQVSVQPPVQPGVQPAPPAASVQRSTRPAAVQHNPPPAGAARPVVEQRPAAGGEAPAKDRARAAARRHATTHGDLPTVTQLIDLAQVSRGTAHAALKDLRDQPQSLHLVTDTDDAKAQP